MTPTGPPPRLVSSRLVSTSRLKRRFEPTVFIIYTPLYVDPRGPPTTLRPSIFVTRTRRSVSLRRRNANPTDHGSVRRSDDADEAGLDGVRDRRRRIRAPRRPQFGVAGTVPPRVGVASRIEEGRPRLRNVDGRAVGVPGDDESGPTLAAEQRERGRPAAFGVRDRDPNAGVGRRRGRREPITDPGDVGVAVDRDESLGSLPEGVEDGRGREVAGVDHQTGGVDRLAGASGQAGVVGAVRVGADDEHRKTRRPAGNTVSVGRLNRHPADGATMAGSKSVVLAALVANGAIAVLKFLAFLLTGSPSMLSETYHSISDTGNQVFLLIGIRYSGREPSRAHPFGYGKAQFFYSFLVSVLLFGIAGWESLKHGYDAILHGHSVAPGTVTLAGVTVDTVYVSVAVLLGAIAFETYAFVKAYAELRRQMDEYGWSGLVEAFRTTSDVTTLTAFTEDAIALGGAVIALVGIVLSRVTGNHIYDAVSAAIIGILLMGFALALAWENKRLLLGESAPAELEDDLRSVVRDHPGVTHVDRFRTMFVGPNALLVAADVSFDPELGTGDIDADAARIEEKLRARDDRVRFVYVEPEL